MIHLRTAVYAGRQLLGAFPPRRMQKSRGRRNARIGTDVYMPGHIIHFSLTPRPTLRIRRAAASGHSQVLQVMRVK
ncbi:hypothetical protein EAF00_000463 [Botryotinia globosa]|nr:hypothetical protein EAF00_000463 [Botryotinia globosa]